MKNINSLLMLIGLLSSGTLSAVNASAGDKDTKENRMKITIADKVFTATLQDNATATAFRAMLPLTLNMEDVNANEKVTRLPAKLSTNDANPERIQAGDLMIWSSHRLVLFYETFPTSYRYTRVGRINEPAGLSAAVGSGNVTVTFELKPGE